jgi:diguanylate cyclase (GGDEF)-like protein
VDATANPFFDPSINARLLADQTILYVAFRSDGTVEWISDSAEFFLGRTAASVIGTDGFAFLHPEDAEVVIQTMLEPARGSADRVRVPIRVRHSNGSWISLEFGGVDLRDADGNGHFLVWGSPHEPTGRLLQFLESMLDGAPLPRLLAQVVAWHDTTTPGTSSAVLVRDHPGGTYRCLATSVALPAELAFDFDPSNPIDGPWVESAAGQKVPSWRDLADLPEAMEKAARSAGFEAVWSIPVGPDSDPEPAALMVLWRRNPGPMPATQRRQLRTTAQVVQLGLQWTVSQRELVTAATTDALTGLANRTQLDARVRNDGSRLAAVLFCDLDDFKQVNDRHGHLAGDRILREAATRMSGAIRTDDLLVRLGGDEFAVWCPALHTSADAEHVARRLIAALDEPFDIDGEQRTVGCSIGVAVVRAEDGMAGKVDRILAAADHSLYQAKREGKGRYAINRGIDRELPFEG